jgi:CelD/BcsL family acetyltransferase involved in cellulose biosynthesis
MQAKLDSLTAFEPESGEPVVANAAADELSCALVCGPDAYRNVTFTAAWNDLASDLVEPNPFYESWFLSAALDAFDPKSSIPIFTVWRGEPHHGTLIGLLPICHAAVYGRWPIAHHVNWLHHNAFLGVPLVRSGFEEQFWRKLLQHVDANCGTSLFLHINGLVIGGPLQRALDRVCMVQARQVGLVNEHERAFLQGPARAEDYYANAVRAKKRKELRRQRNRLAEMGELQFHRSDGGKRLDAWADEFLALERSGWKGENGSALDCAPETRSMFHAALRGAAANGQLDLLDLRLDGKPLALLVNFICRPGSFSFKTAFDEEYARFSPGVLLQIENLALLERSDVDWCDSCAAEGHPMIDSLWTGRRRIGRYSIAIGGFARRKTFQILLQAEIMRMATRPAVPILPDTL